MAAEEIFENMKNHVLKVADDLDLKYDDLEMLKNYFKEDIDSPRTFRKIKSIQDLIVVLEQRDVLNYLCPTPLFYIGDILKNETIKIAIQTYKRCYLQAQNIECCCGKNLEYYHPFSSSLQIEGNCVKSSSTNILNSPNTDLMKAIKNVADRISFWRVLASELNVEEHIIDDIYEKYPKDEKMQALEAMTYWVDREKESASIEQLDKALNARLCKRKGIGSHLRNPLSCLPLSFSSVCG